MIVESLNTSKSMENTRYSKGRTTELPRFIHNDVFIMEHAFGRKIEITNRCSLEEYY